MILSPSIIRSSLVIFVFLFAVLSTGYELDLGALGISLETIFSTWLVLAVMLEKLGGAVHKRQSIYFWFFVTVLIFLLTTVVLDFAITANAGALYEFNFFLLLAVFPTLIYLAKRYELKLERLVLFSFALISIQFMFFPNSGEGWQTWDYIDLLGVGRINRLGVYGYVSNTAAAILVLFLIYFLELIKKYKFWGGLGIVLCLFWLAQTFSRSGILTLIFAILVYAILEKNKRILYLLAILSILVVIGVLSIAALVEFDLLELYANRGSITDNPRVNTWIESIGWYFSLSPDKWLFGVGFFRVAMDSTLVSILIGKGLIGLIMYFVFFMMLFGWILHNTPATKKAALASTIIALVLTSLFMDMFGQRKIIYFAALLCAYYTTEKNEHIRT